ncbi:4-coumarate--CoA ligase 3-like isoform X2 [Gigantopelta aegis]|uniref:4-coumarate--CoA ligase 3-like isoform X2 n=1 Tax=Gigantopelta aegis TaxID=1735272 RepID=UPI001B889FBF|nr:4-coumarate--CoA ligase 3-like isoform X2 [Gigantopelta aegis]
MATVGLRLMFRHVPSNHHSLLTSLSDVLRTHTTRRCSRKLWRCSASQWNSQRSFASGSQTDIYISSPRPPVTIPNEPFAEFMLSSIRQYGDITALVDFPTGRSYTYTQLHDATIKLGSALYKLGYRKGDRLLIFIANCPEYAIVVMACAALGVIVSTCNPSYNSVELARQLVHSGSTSVVCFPELVGTVKEAISSNNLLSQTVKEIIVIGESDGCRPFFPLLEDDGKSFPENVDIDPQNDLLVLPYSSGTTGLPKGVMLTHSNVTANIKQICPALPMEAGKDRLLVILPTFHIYGMVASLYVTLFQGVTMVTLPSFVPPQFINALQKHKITQLQLVPPLIVFLAKEPKVGPSELTHVTGILCGAAPLGKGVTAELEKKCNAPIIQAYGLTETSPATHFDKVPPKHGTIGQLLSNTDGKIVDPTTGVSLGPNQTGEMCIRGPQVMKGYLDNEEATRHTVKNDWLHTGDIAFYDEDGYFTVTDRLKELIKYKGFQVPPAEIEALLLTHPDIKDCAVVGVPDEASGELPRAYIVAKSGKHVNTDEVAKFVEKHMVSYKKLRGGVEVIDAIPKTASGKIIRRTSDIGFQGITIH